jgi:acetyl esterase/lipase
LRDEYCGSFLIADALMWLIQRRPQPQAARQASFADLPAHIVNVTIPTRHGDLRADVYLPEPSDAPVPVYVNLHGGGFVVRHPEQDDPLCRYLAANARVAVINVDYDVAPRHRFPVPVEEAYDAACWAAEPAVGSRHGWDGTRLCVGGQSAGGSVAAAVARLALEQGGPAIALQVLHYPPLDLVTSERDKHAAVKPAISVPMGDLFNMVYIPSPDTRRDRLASPAWGSNADEIAGIAPALMITCEMDVLHDEGVAYAGKLAAVGALREHLDLAGVDHGYNMYVKDRAFVENGYATIAKHVVAATT